jgi:integrase
LRKEALLVFTVKSLTAAKPGRHRIERGLYLEVTKDGESRRFLLRFVSPITHRATEAGLGTYPIVSLADARAKASEYRSLIAKGIDPIQQKREARAQVIAEAKASTTFSDALAAYTKAFADKGASIFELEALLRRHAAVLMPRPLATITTGDVLSALAPVQAKLPKTAARVRAAISTVFAYAKAAGLHAGDNPASREVFKYLTPPPPKGAHHRAMDYRAIPAFWQRLCEKRSAPSLMLRLVILTGLRTSEPRCLSWDEIDLDQRLITIPKERMKARKEHVVPTVSAIDDVLIEARDMFGDQGYLFPGMTKGSPCHPRVLENLLHKQLDVPVSAHGFRSTLRDWLGDCTSVERETAEMILAHTIGGVEGAYRRSTSIEKRRQALILWGEYVTGASAQNVVQFSASARP